MSLGQFLVSLEGILVFVVGFFALIGVSLLIYGVVVLVDRLKKWQKEEVK